MTDETQEQQITAVGNEMSASFLAAKKRSDEILAAIEKNPGKFTMLTGDRPTGRLHLGHYFGSIRERVAMQNRGVNSNIIIADYQVITDRDTTEHIEDNVLNLVLDYMAAGIDPNKTMIFTHSAVPAENQLMLPFLSLVTEAELHRNPTVKSEMEASGHALTGLLLTYPVHQACDILFCKANVVPIARTTCRTSKSPAPSHAASTSATRRRTRCSRSRAPSCPKRRRSRVLTAAR